MRPCVPFLVLGLTLACARSPAPQPQPQPVPPVPAAAQPANPPVSQGTPLAEQPKAGALDPALPAYQPAAFPALAGTLSAIGSDSMEPLMLLWGDDFIALHPGVHYQFVCKGSATAPPALIAGKTWIGQMSREMTPAEIEAFQAAYGYPPTRIVVAADAVAVYVNANNPIPRLNLAEVDAIFSSTRNGGHRPVTTWGDLGLTDDIWRTRAIQPFGRNEESGTRAFFQERVLLKGTFKPNVKALADQFETVEAAAINAAGISYGPFQHKIRMVRAVPIVDFKADQPVPATVENVLNGKYPLTRFLYIYVNHRPGTPLDPLAKAFLTYVLSMEGQRSVSEFGAVSLPADMAAMGLDKLR